jgi:Uma2 family endonuclease
MARPQPVRLNFGTFEEFIRWEQSQPMKHELIDGVPVAMVGGTEAHSIIHVNILSVAREKLRGGPCRALSSDMAAKTGKRQGRYPDVTIDCGKRNPRNLSSPKPTIVFEILSAETQKEDRTVKLAEYNAVPSIAHYVLVEQTEPLAHVYSRAPGGDFAIRPAEIRGLNGAIDLPAIGISLAMAEVYESLDFDAEPDADAPPPTPRPW